MIAQELMVSLTCLYCALAYAIFYLYFQAYPLIFEGKFCNLNLADGRTD